MSVEATVDVPLEIVAGLVTNIVPSDLPHGVSPDCQDIQFQIGSAKTRPGVTLQYTLAGNPTVNSLATYETLTEIPRFVSLDSLGVLRKDVAPGGALTPIFSNLIPGVSFKSASLFGRQYFAFGAQVGLGNPAPFNGSDMPRQYDDTNFDRISQVGPGAAPSAADENVSFTIAAVGVPGAMMLPTGAVQSANEIGNICTLSVQFGVGAGANILIKAGDQFQVAGVGAGYNGTFIAAADVLITGFDNPLISYFNPTTGLAALGAGGTLQLPYAQFNFTAAQTALANIPAGATTTIAGVGVATYNGNWRVAASFLTGGPGGVGQMVVAFGSFGIANSGGGTAVTLGNIAAGKHQISVIFITRSTYYTKPAPPNNWIAGGGKRVTVGNIPIGPPNVVARVVCFTAVNGASFYHLKAGDSVIFSSAMVINDNVTTQATFDFTDAALLLGTLDDPLFNQIVLPPVAGVIDYSNRLLAWGEEANLQLFQNLSFDGAFGTDSAGRNYPLGWIEDIANFAGGGSALTNGNTAIFGDAYRIAGDGVTAIRGKIVQGAAVNYVGTALLAPNTAYTVRARLAVTGATAGTVHINLQSTSGVFTTPGLALAFNTLTATYALVTGSLTNGLASIPSDLLLQVYVDGTPTNGSVWLIDEIEIFPTNAQFNNSNLRASKGQLNTQGQESFDSQTGLIQYSLNDGTSIRTCFKIRERLYIVKEHSFGVTQDDGVNEPALWTVLDVSKKIGTPSINGVGIGEDWVVIAHRTGLYIFWGGGVEKISQEIQPTWDTINWQQGTTISVAVDTRRRRIFICAPFGTAVQPNKTLVLDYHDVGSDAAAIAANPPIHLTYTGAKRAFDRARKWCPWTIPANSIAAIEQANGTALVYFGSNDLTGNINKLDDTGTVFTDNGAMIPSYYVTSFLPDRETKQGLQLTAHRELFSYMTTFSQGVGNLGLTVYLDSLSNGIVLNPQALSNPAVKDLEVGINQTIERMAVKFSNSGAGNWFDLQNLVLNVRPDPWAVVRGSN